MWLASMAYKYRREMKEMYVAVWLANIQPVRAGWLAGCGLIWRLTSARRSLSCHLSIWRPICGLCLSGLQLSQSVAGVSAWRLAWRRSRQRNLKKAKRNTGGAAKKKKSGKEK
jgi:hypothetical protein